MLRRLLLLLAWSHAACGHRSAAPGPGVRGQMVGRVTPEGSHPLVVARALEVDRVVVDEPTRVVFWSQLASGGPARLAVDFRALPDWSLTDGRSAEPAWFGAAGWERIAQDLHEAWEVAVRSRSDVVLVPVVEVPVLMERLRGEGCARFARPFGLATARKREGRDWCGRMTALDRAAITDAVSAGAIDGAVSARVVVAGCPIAGETEWWTGVMLRLRFTMLAPGGNDAGGLREAGFHVERDASDPRAPCYHLPVARGGARVDRAGLGALLGVELERLVLEHLALLPPVDAPWPVADGRGAPP